MGKEEEYIKLNFPINADSIRMLKIGDMVVVSGIIHNARDMTQRRIVEYLNAGEKLPFDLQGTAIYIGTGPAFRKVGDKTEITMAGPTSSARCNPYAPQLIEKLGIRAIISKSGMDTNVLKAMRKFGCVYLAAVGGAAPYYAQFVKSAVCVAWPELAIEALWRYEVENLGPLLVAMDTHGQSYYEESDKAITENAGKISAKLEAQAGRSLESPYMKTFHTTHAK